MKAVALISGVFPQYLSEEFEHALNRLISPDQIGRRIVTEILSAYSENDDDAGGFRFNQELSTRLQQVGDIAKALEILLVSLELDRGIVSHSNFDPTSEDGSGFNHIQHGTSGLSSDVSKLFASPTGVSVLAESLNQMAVTRFRLFYPHFSVLLGHPTSKNHQLFKKNAIIVINDNYKQNNR